MLLVDFFRPLQRQAHFIVSILLFLFPSVAIAMDMTYEPEGRGAGLMAQWPAYIYLEGPVEWGDDKKLKKLLAQHPDVEEIVVGKSPGGSLHAGIYIAKIIYESGIPLQLNGPAASAATVISLGARNQVTFGEDSKGFKGTQLLFHCAYLRGETVCDGEGTRILSETLASFTRRSADDWYQFLMEETTPETVEPVRLFALLNKSWNCASETHQGTTCYRIDGKENTVGPIVMPGDQEVVEASRPNLAEALDYVSQQNVSDKTSFRIFESENGWFAISRQSLSQGICSDYIKSELEMGLGDYPPSDAFCSSGDKFLRKYHGVTGDEFATSDENIIPVYRVRDGYTGDGYLELYEGPNFDTKVKAKIYDGSRFYVVLSGSEWWRVRDQVTKRTGWINPGTAVESIYR